HLSTALPNLLTIAHANPNMSVSPPQPILLTTRTLARIAISYNDSQISRNLHDRQLELHEEAAFAAVDDGVRWEMCGDGAPCGFAVDGVGFTETANYEVGFAVELARGMASGSQRSR